MISQLRQITDRRRAPRCLYWFAYAYAHAYTLSAVSHNSADFNFADFATLNFKFQHFRSFLFHEICQSNTLCYYVFFVVTHILKEARCHHSSSHKQEKEVEGKIQTHEKIIIEIIPPVVLYKVTNIKRNLQSTVHL